MRNNGTERPGRAVVMGAGLSGLLAARVLSDFFEEVVVLEKDAEPAGPFTRKGAPQGDHGHILLKTGADLLEAFFPGIGEELAKAGAFSFNASSGLRWYHAGCWKLEHTSRINLRLQTRPLLEWTVLRRLQDIPNIRLRYATASLGPAFNPRLGKVEGVWLRPTGSDAAPELLHADLVTDASGAASRTRQWLENNGFEPPGQTIYNVNIVYTSRLYEIPEAFRSEDWGILYIRPMGPSETRGGGIMRVEGNRWLVTMLGFLGKGVAPEEDAFLEFARTLPQPHVYEYIRDARPLSDLRVYRTQAAIRNHYERLRRFPDGLIVTGDAFCRLDPVFGQGISVAAQEAFLLQQCLTQAGGRLDGLHRTFHGKAARGLFVPWLMAKCEDLRYPSIPGHRGLLTRLLMRYNTGLYKVIARDADACERFIGVLNLCDHPIRLFSPAMLWKVGRELLKRR